MSFCSQKQGESCAGESARTRAVAIANSHQASTRVVTRAHLAALRTARLAAELGNDFNSRWRRVEANVHQLPRSFDSHDLFVKLAWVHGDNLGRPRVSASPQPISPLDKMDQMDQMDNAAPGRQDRPSTPHEVRCETVHCQQCAANEPTRKPEDPRKQGGEVLRKSEPKREADEACFHSRRPRAFFIWLRTAFVTNSENVRNSCRRTNGCSWIAYLIASQAASINTRKDGQHGMHDTDLVR